MPLHIRYLKQVPQELKSEVRLFSHWLRKNYIFKTPLEIKLINDEFLIDFDGTKCYMRYWQLSNKYESVKVQIAVGNFEKYLKEEGESTAYPTVLSAIGRGICYYYQFTENVIQFEEISEEWVTVLLNSYCENNTVPSWPYYRIH